MPGVEPGATSESARRFGAAAAGAVAPALVVVLPTDAREAWRGGRAGRRGVAPL